MTTNKKKKPITTQSNRDSSNSSLGINQPASGASLNSLAPQDVSAKRGDDANASKDGDTPVEVSKPKEKTHTIPQALSFLLQPKLI
jgi:hypothetical protein